MSHRGEPVLMVNHFTCLEWKYEYRQINIGVQAVNAAKLRLKFTTHGNNQGNLGLMKVANPFPHSNIAGSTQSLCPWPSSTWVEEGIGAKVSLVPELGDNHRMSA